MNKIIIFLLCVSSLHAQSIDPQKLDSLFDTMNKNLQAMGGISISSEGVEVYQKL